MRINLYIAKATGLSRRMADRAITERHVKVNGQLAALGSQVRAGDRVTYNDHLLELQSVTQTIMLNKPVGYVCSRDGQGSQTIYDLLPEELHQLKPVGRLDKDSSGLLLLTNDGLLANQLTHPSFNKEKVYEVWLNKPLLDADKLKIEKGIRLDDGMSKLSLQQIEHSKQKIEIPNNPNSYFLVSMTEGRNRQIRRTFAALGYKVLNLNRLKFGQYSLGSLQLGKYITL